jgi:hypothetical protein
MRIYLTTLPPVPYCVDCGKEADMVKKAPLDCDGHTVWAWVSGCCGSEICDGDFIYLDKDKNGETIQ